MNIIDKSSSLAVALELFVETSISWLVSPLHHQWMLCSTANTHAIDFVSLLEYSKVYLGCFWFGLRQNVIQKSSLKVKLSQHSLWTA